jgi:hypothetical protein
LKAIGVELRIETFTGPADCKDDALKQFRPALAILTFCVRCVSLEGMRNSLEVFSCHASYTGKGDHNVYDAGARLSVVPLTLKTEGDL